jgi:hypothetical protein
VISKVELADGKTDAEACVEVQQLLQNEGESPQSWPVDECRLLGNLKNQKIEALLRAITYVDPLKLDPLEQSFLAHPLLLFFLYSGRLDVFVPVESFAEETARFGARIRYRSFTESGHEGYLTEPEVWADLAR